MTDMMPRVIRSTDGKLELWSEREQRLIRTTVRTGAWAILGGAMAYVLGPIGAFSPVIRWAVVGLGLTGGGIAAAIGSALVLRRVWKGPFRHLKVASIIGVPFGICTAVLGAGWLSRSMAVNGVTAHAAPAAVLLGLALSALFGTGLVRRFWRALRDEAPQQHLPEEIARL